MRGLALLASVGSVLVSFWLLSVVTVVLPRGNADQIPFWSIVMIGFFAFGSLSWYTVQHANTPRILRTLLLLASAAAVLLGLAAIVENEIRTARTGDWEAYISVMGIALAGHGVVLLTYLLRRKRVDSGAQAALPG